MDADCASKLRVLADPTRLRVVEALMEQPRCVHELMELLQVEQSLLSHHLRVLRDAGLVNGVRRGRAVLYGLAPEAEVGEQAIDLGCCRLSFETPAPAPGRGDGPSAQAGLREGRGGAARVRARSGA